MTVSTLRERCGDVSPHPEVFTGATNSSKRVAVPLLLIPKEDTLRHPTDSSERSANPDQSLERPQTPVEAPERKIPVTFEVDLIGEARDAVMPLLKSLEEVRPEQHALSA